MEPTCEAVKNLIGLGPWVCLQPANIKSNGRWLCADCYRTEVDNLESIPLRDRLAAHEPLGEWELASACPETKSAMGLVDRPVPAHGWSCQTPEEWRAMIQWEAEFLAALKYICADAMLKARAK